MKLHGGQSSTLVEDSGETWKGRQHHPTRGHFPPFFCCFILFLSGYPLPLTWRLQNRISTKEKRVQLRDNMSYPFLHPDHRTSHTLVLRAKRCTTLLSNELHSVLCVKTHLHVHSSDVSGQSGYNVRTARSTSYEPNVALDENGTTFRSIADGDDEDLLGIKSFHLGQAPPFFSPGIMFLEEHRIPFNTQHLLPHMTNNWKCQGHGALHYQQEQFENAAQPITSTGSVSRTTNCS